MTDRVFTVEPDKGEAFAVPAEATVAQVFDALEGEFPLDPPRVVTVSAFTILPATGDGPDDGGDDDGADGAGGAAAAGVAP